MRIKFFTIVVRLILLFFLFCFFNKTNSILNACKLYDDYRVPRGVIETNNDGMFG